MAKASAQVSDGIRALEALADGSAGARFRLADLQLHTPVDKNFRAGMAVGTAAERAKFARAYVEAARSKGLETIAVTEHNDVSWLDELRAAAAEMGDLVVFPAFEVASSEGVHVLCLFEPDASAEALDELLTELGLPSDRRFHDDGSPQICSRGLVNLVDFIQTKRGGLCVLSHVDRDDGVLHRLDGEVRTRAWCDCDALAAQCSKNPRLMDEGSFNRRVLENEADQYRRKRPYACIQTSDARTLDTIGSKPTYIKLASPTLAGLRQAFLDPGSRVHFPDAHAPAPAPRILAATWDGAFLRAELPLNPDLNCLIGGKGTAKSTVIETIRHAFALDIPSEAVREQAEALLGEVFKRQARVSILVEISEPAPTRYVIERTGPERPIVRLAETGEIREGLSPTDLLQPVVFGQREIYETAQRVESQLALLDRYCANDVQPLQGEVEKILRRVTSATETVRREEARIAAADEELAELPALQERKRLYEEAGIGQKAAEASRYRREQDYLDAVAERIDEHADMLAALRRDLGDIGGLPALDDPPNPQIMGEAEEVLVGVGNAWESAATTVETRIDDARQELAAIRARWEERHQEAQAALAEARRAIGDAEEVHSYVEIDSRIAELERLQTDMTPRRQAVRRAAGERRELLTELREVHRRIFQVRERTAAELTRRLEGAVRVTVEHQANRTAVLEQLYEAKTGATRSHLDALVGHDAFSPELLAELCREGSDALTERFEIPTGSANKLARGLDANALDALESTELEDRVEIALNVRGEQQPEYRALDRLSAGQRSTAVLLLALLESDAPLLLDQPEDDLDNLFIYEEVVQRLRTAKERRQFVIATHNANIPVLGDAEQIVVLETATDEDDQIFARVRVRGSIDDEELLEPVEEILEGGQEAFEHRKRKYGF